ncbi:MAG: anti-sigma F factor [Clostridiales bacterium]|nr:anti-sigma F factor [Clostridiales bacterium]
MKRDRSNRIKLTFSNCPENERIGRMMAATYAASLNPTMEELSDFKIAVSEAITNAIIHAYPEKEGTITMILEKKGNEVGVHIIDEGIGMQNVRHYMEPMVTTMDSQEHSGMGFTFMEAFADQLEVESEPGKGTTIYLLKKMGGEHWNEPVN